MIEDDISISSLKSVYIWETHLIITQWHCLIEREEERDLMFH